jgi:hypothetical protein
MSVLTAETVVALTAGRLAHLMTINPDGSPKVSMVWVGVEKEAEGRNDIGLDHYVVVYAAPPA